MKKFKQNNAGMTLIEVLVAMSLFTIMFMMIFGIMINSTRMNARTRLYDQEIDVHIESAERYNPMAVTIDGNTSTSADIEKFDAGTTTLNFDFPSTGKFISIDALAFQVESKNESNGFSLKFFNSTRPDVANSKYWVRIYNLTSSEENAKLYLYVPKDNGGMFYLKSGSEALTEKAARSIAPKTATAIGFDAKEVSGSDLFIISTKNDERDVIEKQSEDIGSLIKVSKNEIYGGKYDTDKDGYIDIYYCDGGLMSYDEYQEYLKKSETP